MQQQPIKERAGGIGGMLAALAVALGAMLAGPAIADSWAPPRVQTYVSPDGATRLTVSPRQIRDQLAYFDDKVEGREPAGQRPGGQAEARGKLERRVGGRWQAVWDKPLVNEVAPVSALVSDGGAYVVTFDNWHSVGHGENVVVIYDATGGLVRSLTLADILPENYVEALPRSISSIHWRGEPRISGDTLVLKVVVPGDDDDRYVEVRIDLAGGAVQPPSGRAWEAALAEVAKVNAVQAEEQAKWVAEMRRPLEAPTTSDNTDWMRYLYEAFRRVAPDWDEQIPMAMTLVLPSEEDYGEDLDLFVGVLQEGETEDGGNSFIVASPDQSNMAAVLVEAASELGKLKGKRLYIVADDAHWPALKAALTPTGVELIQIDPTKPIPQRPERLPK